MNKINLFLFSSLFIGILFLIFIVTLLNPNEKTIEVSSFPAFEMNELNEEPINQYSFQEGEYKLINVWATWCVNCKLEHGFLMSCLLYTSPSPRDVGISRMPSSA